MNLNYVNLFISKVIPLKEGINILYICIYNLYDALTLCRFFSQKKIYLFPQALKILVAGVPSMHICLSFLPELLRITDNSQRIFGLNLLAQLSLQYSMPKTLDMCRLALRIGLTMAQVRMTGCNIQLFSRSDITGR